jgi:hypothetical protein
LDWAVRGSRRDAHPARHDRDEYCRKFDLPMRPFVVGNRGLVFIGGSA